MRSRNFYVFAMLIIALLGSASAIALTLDEYGITLTDDGLLDNQTGLQWLDAAATEGTTANLNPFFANGWRLATEQELLFLLLRIPNSVGDTAISMLNFDDYLVRYCHVIHSRPKNAVEREFQAHATCDHKANALARNKR